MDIILLKDIEKVGDKFDVVKVKNGYGRNYLIPQKLALIANDTNLRRLEDLRRRQNAKESKMVSHYQAIVDKLKGKVLKIGAKAGTSGKIFGSVTSIQLSSALMDQFQVEVVRKKIELPDNVKTIGAYTAKLNMHPDVQGTVDFEVIAE